MNVPPNPSTNRAARMMIIVLTGQPGATVARQPPPSTKLYPRRSVKRTAVGGGSPPEGPSTDPSSLTHQTEDALAVADLVVSRAGLSTLSELAALKKPAIIIPLPGTHQEENARFFAHDNAVLMAEEGDLSAAGLTKAVRETLGDVALLQGLGSNIQKTMKPQGRENIAQEIIRLAT